MSSKDRYAEYLKTDYWKEVTSAVKKRAGWKCQVCNSPHDLQAHHRTYDNRGNELDHLDDLICMCRRCHGVFHGQIEPERPKSKKKAGNGRPNVSVLDQMPPNSGPIVMTKELLDRTRANGSFTNATIRAYGLSAPLKSGWAKGLIGKEVSRRTYMEALIGKYWYNSGRL